jgi:hypothetical protein
MRSVSHDVVRGASDRAARTVNYLAHNIPPPLDVVRANTLPHPPPPPPPRADSTDTTATETPRANDSPLARKVPRRGSSPPRIGQGLPDLGGPRSRGRKGSEVLAHSPLVTEWRSEDLVPPSREIPEAARSTPALVMSSVTEEREKPARPERSAHRPGLAPLQQGRTDSSTSTSTSTSTPASGSTSGSMTDVSGNVSGSGGSFLHLDAGGGAELSGGSTPAGSARASGASSPAFGSESVISNATVTQDAVTGMRPCLEFVVLVC